MRISDWSSDVCSSDLAPRRPHPAGLVQRGHLVDRTVARSPPCRVAQSSVRVGGRGAAVIGIESGAVLGRTHIRFVPASEDRGTGFAHVYRSEEHTSALQSLMRLSSSVFCFNKTMHP